MTQEFSSVSTNFAGLMCAGLVGVSITYLLNFLSYFY